MSNKFYEGCVFHYNVINEYNISGGETKMVLMSHPLYFLQNGLNELYDNDVSNVNDNSESEFTNFKNNVYAKALLLLHSMPFNYENDKIKSFFNNPNSKNGGYEVVPYGMLALMGGLLYRQNVYKKTGKDFVYTGDYYKSPGIDKTFLVKGKNGISLGIIKNGCKNKEYIPINNIINEHLELYVKNALIKLFLEFVEYTQRDFFNIIELRYKPKNSKNSILFTYNTYNDFLTSLQKIDKQNSSYQGVAMIHEILSGGEEIKINNVISKIDGFTECYATGIIDNTDLLIFYKERNLALHMLLDKLYNHKSGVLSLACQTDKKNNGVVSLKTYKNVINGFANTLQVLMQRYKTEQELRSSGDIKESKNKADDDIKAGIYTYFKQIWDKWLCGIYNDTDKRISENKTEPFTVKWFEEQFLFIDSFYRDIYSVLKIDCSMFDDYLSTISSTNGSTNGTPSAKSILAHLADVAAKNRCNFFCYPDFINFNRSKNKHLEVKNVLNEMFTPIPYNQLNNVVAENQFVIIRTNECNITDNKQFVDDSFEIWSSDEQTKIAPLTFQEYDIDDEKGLRIGYKVPSFGVAYSRQNNSIFKTVDISMDSQQVTEQAINQLCYISSQLGNANKRAVSFYGNDLYAVYTAYSYIVTVTMLGNAQIQPLMYFQLMNIPLFRGTYMIIEVKHSMKAGDFVTTFRGVRLSKVEPPLTSTWFTVAPEESKPKEILNIEDCEKIFEIK
jgi:hypothetical protein